MKKRAAALCAAVLLAVWLCCTAFAAEVPKVETPNYKVAFYAFDCYHMQDADGRRTGYGYDMMQRVANYMQCTFSYVGYDKTAEECVEMLRNGDIDIYTAARLTDERQQEFAISKHPAITATTCMNVKAGNTSVVAGDYSTYNGLRVGLLRRHTYNGRFEQFVAEKGFTCTIRYYETPTELTNALVHGEVDALVNSYIRTPEDERTVENFGQTPYYIMARKEDQALIDQIDAAIDGMNTETPNWRADLYNQYYGTQDASTEFTDDEIALLAELKTSGAVIRGVMSPDAAPYAWFEDGEAKGMAADLFAAAAEKLGLPYEILPVADCEEYNAVLADGTADIWIDLDSYYEDEGTSKYKITTPYLTTTVSVLHHRGSSGRLKKLAVVKDSMAVREILTATWPGAEVEIAGNAAECVKKVLSGEVDGALLMSYTAQKLARDDIQNRLSVDIVPGAVIQMQMGVNAQDDYRLYGLWQKALSEVADTDSAEIVQSYLQSYTTPTMVEYLFDNPIYLVFVLVLLFLLVLLAVMAASATRRRREQQHISEELAKALAEAREANEAKQNFFSKMSHDIRTPLNVVLGMTQIAQKYKEEPARLASALESITTEGNHLLVLINSILDVNQLEHGHIELQVAPFDPAEQVRSSVELLRPLADKKEQTLTVACDSEDTVVVGDANRFVQIMLNIVSNAIKYTDAGGHIEVSLNCLPGGRCRFTCTDNGMGMTNEFITHISEDYVRAEDSRISKIQGTGLGMSVVKGFTDLMHGTLRIESEPGKGSTFAVEIPFAEATEEQRQALRAAAEREKRENAEFAGKTVLLAEDNALNAEIATELLGTLGFTVDWVEDGKQAVEKFKTSAPRYYFAIFMDMQMPVMDGVEATKAIRALPRADRHVPIYAMTANTFAQDRQNCRDAGMDGYISKPFTVKDIANTVKR